MYNPDIPKQFNVQWYLTKYYDVAQYIILHSLPSNWAWDHYVTYGLWEKREVIPFPDESNFCAENYLKVYQDVASDSYYSQHPYQHFKDFGFAEGRLACPKISLPPIDASFPANWCFAPQEYEGYLFFPYSNNGGSEHGGHCNIMVYNNGWAINYQMGSGTEDICKLIPYKDRLYAIVETYKYFSIKMNIGSSWIPQSADQKPYPDCVKEMGPKPTQYGAFDACVCGDILYVPIAAYDQSYPLILWKHDGNIWEKTPHEWRADDERPTGWACGSDGENIFVGIAGFGRGLNDNTRFDGIWRIDKYGTKYHEGPGIKAQSFIMLPNGEMLCGTTGGNIHARRGGTWPIVFSTGCKFVCSLAWIDNELWIGGDYPARLFRAPGWNFQLVKSWLDGSCYVGSFMKQPVYAHYENDRAYIGRV